jgi:hypothetical protein
MSKKKNTLKDLDEFLKQQAATLVPPTPLVEQTQEATKPKEDVAHEQRSPEKEIPDVTFSSAQEISHARLLEDFLALANKEGLPVRKELYRVILHILESQANALPEDKMLINTVLYLQSGSEWKENIRRYWQNKQR